MPISNYGVWKVTPTKWSGTSDDNHGILTFTDGSNKTNLTADVNIESTSSDTRLVYWLNSAFDATHPTIQSLTSLSLGFAKQSGSSSLALDFLRSGLVDVNKGILLSHDAQTAGDAGSSDIIDYLNPIMNSAITDKATVYLYGSQYNDSDGASGIHDIHMNQGNAGSFKKDNGTYQDGGIIISFPDGHWEAVFLAFAVQATTTDDTGNPASGSETFATLLGGANAPAAPKSDDDTGVPAGKSTASGAGAVAIEAAIVNPVGPDRKPTSGLGETVYIMNRSSAAVSLKGWTISNGKGSQVETLGDVSLAANSKKGFSVPEAPLSNKGGKIVLKNPAGKVVHEVEYSEKQAKKEGKLLYFQ